MPAPAFLAMYLPASMIAKAFKVTYAICLRACYEMSGTDLAYAATRAASRRWGVRAVLRDTAAIYGEMTAIYGEMTAIYGEMTAIYGGIADRRVPGRFWHC
eukprot:3147110-Rhodomonas_salina.2